MSAAALEPEVSEKCLRSTGPAGEGGRGERRTKREGVWNVAGEEKKGLTSARRKGVNQRFRVYGIRQGFFDGKN